MTPHPLLAARFDVQAERHEYDVLCRLSDAKLTLTSERVLAHERLRRNVILRAVAWSAFLALYGRFDAV